MSIDKVKYMRTLFNDLCMETMIFDIEL